MEPVKHTSLKLLTALPLLLALSACGKTPQDWMTQGQTDARQGDSQAALQDYDQALASQGPWQATALFLKAKALMDLQRWDEAARCALDSAKSAGPSEARAALVLALQAWSKAGDSVEGAKAFALLGDAKEAIKDPEVAAAAEALGLVQGGAAMPDLTQKAAGFNMAQTDAVRLAIARVSTATALDPRQFPLRTDFQDPLDIVKVPSPDGHFTVWRGQDSLGYWLYLFEAATGRTRKLTVCKNGYQPVWSPDSKRILYSAMDWRMEERNLFIYDISTGLSRRAFNARRKVGALASWSPDGSKIVFTYFDDLWIMNSDGIGRSLLNLSSRLAGRPVLAADLIAWSRDGTSLAYRMRGEQTIYLLELAPKL
jgi:tetratricopeptide (TPR) repeat protein